MAAVTAQRVTSFSSSTTRHSGVKPSSESKPWWSRLQLAHGFIAVGLFLVAAGSCAPIYAHLTDRWGINDWDEHFADIEAARRLVLAWDQWPLWNPYKCGGVELLASPSSLVLSPSFLLVLAVGTVPAMKLLIPLHLWLGSAGMYVVAGRYGLSGAVRFMPPILFMLSSVFTLHVTAGSVEWLAMGWLPWTVWWMLREIDGHRPRHIAGAAATLALAYLGGGGTFVLYTGLLCACIAVTRAIQLRRLRCLGSLLLVGVLAGGLAAPKLLPGLAVESRYPRTVPMFGYREAPLEVVAPATKSLSHFELWRRVFADRSQAQMLRDSIFWTEYGAYVGWLGLGLGVLGCVAAARRFPDLLAVPVLFLIVAEGSRAPVSLWGLLTSLPILRNLNHPPRFVVLVLFCLALGAGLAVALAMQVLQRWSASRQADRPEGLPESLPPLIASGVAVVMLADLLLVHFPVWRLAFSVGATSSELRVPFYQTFAEEFMLPPLLANRGVIQAYDHNGRPRCAVAAESPLYRGEGYLESGKGHVQWERFSGRVLRLTYDTPVADRLVINQNAADGWQLTEGRAELEPRNGLLAVDVPAGSGQVELRYHAPGLAAGAVFLVAFVVSLVVWERRWLHAPGGPALFGVSSLVFVAVAGYYGTNLWRPKVAAQDELRLAREASYEGRQARSARYWEVVAERYPTYQLAYEQLASALLHQRRIAECRDAAERAVLLAPSSSSAQLSLARAWSLTERFPARALETQPEFFFELARRYAERGRPELALCELRYAFELGLQEPERIGEVKALASVLDRDVATQVLGEHWGCWLSPPANIE